jgi:hypothetical protein
VSGVAKGCVLNELSIENFDARVHNALQLFERLDEICRLLGARLWLWDGLLRGQSADWQRVVQQLMACRSKDRDQARRVRALLTGAQTFVDESGDAVVIHAESVRGGTRVRGLARALLVRGMAVSLDTTQDWNCSWIRLDVRADASGADALRQLLLNDDLVRHVSQVVHLKEHETSWHVLADADRLRVLLALKGAWHVPASVYGLAKHVQGKTNDARKTRAAAPAGDGQYFAERNGTPVTDTVIEGWEREILNRVDRGQNCTVERHGGAYHVYADIGHPIGYLGGSGDETASVRVEWSAGHVHSHPRMRSKR